MMRRAYVYGARTSREVSAYLPAAYRVVGSFADPYEGGQAVRTVVVIEGRDVAGWTLADYVIPRLASGLMVAREVSAGTTLVAMNREGGDL